MDQASDDKPQSQVGITQKTGSKRKAPASEAQSIADANSEALETLMKANDALMSYALEFTQDVLAFNANRLQENVRRSQTLMSTRNPEEAFRAESEFYQSAVQEYVDQAGKMFALMTKMNRECWGPWEDRVRAAIEGLQKR
jgi:hypothetical protein